MPLELSSERWPAFAAAALFMLVGSLWIANALCTFSAQRLPVSVGEQITVFETCCAFLYGYLLAWQSPQSNEVLGMLLVLGCVIWTLRTDKHVPSPRQRTNDQSAKGLKH